MLPWLFHPFAPVIDTSSVAKRIGVFSAVSVSPLSLRTPENPRLRGAVLCLKICSMFNWLSDKLVLKNWNFTLISDNYVMGIRIIDGFNSWIYFSFLGNFPAGFNLLILDSIFNVRIWTNVFRSKIELTNRNLVKCASDQVSRVCSLFEVLFELFVCVAAYILLSLVWFIGWIELSLHIVNVIFLLFHSKAWCFYDDSLFKIFALFY